MIGGVIVIVAVAVLLEVVKPTPDPVDVTVITADPAVTPVTTPVDETVATVGVALTNALLTEMFAAATSAADTSESVDPMVMLPVVGGAVNRAAHVPRDATLELPTTPSDISASSSPLHYLLNE